MKENYLNQSQKKIIEILPIGKSRGIIITKKDQIKEIVEGPLVKACEVFWDKNIKTYESSANNQNISTGFCYIRIDFDSLSEENKKITKQYGEPYNDVGVQVLELDIPITESETINEISDKAVNIANIFKKQAPTWIHPITLEDTIKYYEERYGSKYPETVSKEKERLNQPGVWEEECKRLGYYFDVKTQKAYESEEYYKKIKSND